MISSLIDHSTAAVISHHPTGYQSQMHTPDTGYINPQTIQNSLRYNFLRCKGSQRVFSPKIFFKIDHCWPVRGTPDFILSIRFLPLPHALY